MATRKERQTEAVLAETEKTFAPELTVRRIGLREEFLLVQTCGELLSAETLAQLATGAPDVGKLLPSLFRAVFICSQPFERMNALISAGADVFNSAFFAFLDTAPRSAFHSAAAWILKDIAEIAASAFDVAGDEAGSAAEKNVRFPAVPPS